MKPKICLVINCIILNESARRIWSELARHLAASGVRLVMLSTASHEQAMPFTVIPIPFLLRDYVQKFPRVRPEIEPLTEQDWALLEGDSFRSQGAYTAAEAIPGLHVCRHIMGALLKTLDPGYVLTWDSTLPLAIIIQDLCMKGGWPVQTIERGLLPDTFMIESRGIQAFSDLRTHWMAQEIPQSAYDAAAFERIRAFYLNNKPQKYDQPSFEGGGRQLREELKLGDKKVVVFFGQYDPCGFAPPQSQIRRGYAPVFRSTEDTLTNLWAFLEHHPETALVFKAHPLDVNPYTKALAHGVRIVKNVNVHALIDLADAVVAQFTTLQFEAALYDKPIVLAARSAWWGRGATYEVHEREDLPAAVFAALRKQEWGTRAANARAFLTWIMDSWLISGGAAPARRTVADLAKYLAQTSLDSGCSTPIDDRLREMRNLLRSWKFGPLPQFPPRVVPSDSRETELLGKLLPEEIVTV